MQHVSMENLIGLPDDIFKQNVMYFLTLRDVNQLDNATTNHLLRPILLVAMDGSIVKGYGERRMSRWMYEWVGKRRIYILGVVFHAEFDILCL